MKTINDLIGNVMPILEADVHVLTVVVDCKHLTGSKLSPGTITALFKHPRSDFVLTQN